MSLFGMCTRLAGYNLNLSAFRSILHLVLRTVRSMIAWLVCTLHTFSILLGEPRLLYSVKLGYTVIPAQDSPIHLRHSKSRFLCPPSPPDKVQEATEYYFLSRVCADGCGPGVW